MEPVKCFIPETLEEALRIRKETGATVLAGGSDLMVANSMGAGVTPAFKGDVLIITNLKELKGIRALPDGSVEIGACTTSAEIARSPIAPELLKDAASRMGAIALRNSATIGGNIGNASPKGDMPQPLILMDAEVVLTSVDGERRMLVDDYIIATKKTALREDEIITKVIIPKQDFTHTFFRKIGMRRANAISKLTLSAAATVRDGVLVDFRASSGAAGPKVARSRKAEELLIGKKVSELSDKIVSYPQILRNVRVNSNAEKTAIMESPALREAIAKAEGELAGNGRVLIRPSGTEPLIRVMVEAGTEQQAQAVTQALVQHVENLQKSSEK